MSAPYREYPSRIQEERVLKQVFGPETPTVAIIGIMECSICLESLLEESNSRGCSATQCGHIFHRKCLIDWLKTNPSCPKCRWPVLTYELRQIYLEGSDDAPRAKKSSKEQNGSGRIVVDRNSQSLLDDFKSAFPRVWGMRWKILDMTWIICVMALMIWGVIRLIYWLLGDGSSELGNGLDALRDGLGGLENELDSLGNGLNALKDRLDDLRVRLDDLRDRLDDIMNRFG